MKSNSLLLPGVLGATAVVLGAFGAHALKAELTPSQLSSYQTGISYHFIHTLAILALSLSANFRGKKLALRLFTIGIICFSGSIYLLTTKELTGIPIPSLFGLVTPLGGLFFIGGWISLIFSGFGKSDID